MSDAPAIFEALAAVMADVQAVAKRDRNDHQKFMFRGIDAVMNAVGPALRTHHVIVTPDVRSVTYEDVTTSTGKASTACRVEVAYTFYAIDGSSISTSVAGEAWDHGDKACPKAMSVAFRTALLQALCLPTDEPDPDTHTYERSTVDMSQVNAAIVEAQALQIEGDYDGTREWAAQSQANADAAASKLRKAIAAKRAEQAEEKSGTEDQAPTEEAGEGDTQADPAASPSTSGDTDTPGTSEGADTASAGDESVGEGLSSPAPDTPAWRMQAEAEGITDAQLLIGLQKAWPKNDDAARPTRTAGLDAVAGRHEGLFASVIEQMAREQRQGASA